jgi:hypothetical protein
MADSKKLLVYGDQEKNKLAKNQDPSTYVRTQEDYSRRQKKSEALCAGELQEQFRQPEENIFDYLVFNFVDYDLLRSGAHHRALAHSAMFGGSTSTRPGVRKSPSRPAISSTSATWRSQQRSGTRQQLRLRSWI